VNERGLPLQIELSPGQAHDAPMAELLLQGLPKGASLLADRGYDADWIREMIEDQDCTPVIGDLRLLRRWHDPHGHGEAREGLQLL
jgi:transposase